MAQGRTTPSIPPVWERHLLDAPDPPRVICAHHEYDQVAQGSTQPLVQVQRSFFFGSNDFSLLRRLLPPHLRNCTTKFELLTSFLWRCRTIAISPDPNEIVRMLCVNSTRSKFNPPLPSGYYGNTIVIPAAITTAEMLCRNPLGYAVELVSQAKASATVEYVKSVASLMVINGKRLHYPNVEGTYIISDTTKLGFTDVDYGWGKAEFVAAKAVDNISYFISAKNKKGEKGTLVPINLPEPSMERFAKELDNILIKEKSFFVSSSM